MQPHKSAVVFAVVCIAGLLSSTAVAEKLLVSVFYETLCPDSIRFIKNQVYPVYTQLSDSIQLDLVPYGFGNTTLYTNGSATFNCQHGSDECYGNKVHVCALASLESDKAAAFVNCSMSQSNPPSAGPLCASQLNVSYTRIEECVNSQEGELLLAAYGVRTHSQTPSIYWLPWITYNNTFYEQELDASQENLLPVVCKHMITKPAACYNVYHTD